MKKIILLTTIFSLLIQSSMVFADDYWSNYKKGIKLLDGGNYKEASVLLEKGVSGFEKQKNNTNTAMMFNKLGKAYAFSGNYTKAEESWRKEAIYWTKLGKNQESIAANRKADLIRNDIRIFTENNNLNTSHGVKYEPKNGVLLGLYGESDKVLNNGNANYAYNTESVFGKHHAGYLLYYTWGKPLSNLKIHVENAKNTNSFLQLGIEPFNGLDEVKDDEYLDSFVNDLKSFEIPIFLRFANEMNDPSNKYWYEKDPKKYIEKYRLVADKVHKEAPNVVMVWAPGYFPPDNITSYYPGDKYVDWVGVSIYRQYHPELDPLSKNVDRFTFLDHFSNIYNLYSNKKPMMISECGVSYTSPKDGKDLTKFAKKELSDYLTYMPIMYPKLKAMFYFDTSVNSKGTSYRITDNQEIWDIYNKGISSPSYISHIGDNSEIGYNEIIKTISASKNNNLYSFIKTPDNNISEVVYSINDKIIGKSKLKPYKVDINFNDYINKTINLKIQGFNGKTKIVEENLKINVIQ